MSRMTHLWSPMAPLACTLAATVILLLGGCSKDDEPAATAGAAGPPAPAATSAPATATPVPEPEAPPPPPTEDAANWSPDALDEIVAPIALYPDPILAQVLAASTDSQELLDAGNWLIDNPALEGGALTKAAATAEFTPPVQALVHFPNVVDMMCREFDWTNQLGAAFTADQSAVLDSVQRLRKQAYAAGNLQSTPQMGVEKTVQQEKEVIVIESPDPKVVYVPQYDVAQAYTAAPAPAAVTTTTGSSGISTTEAVVGGVLAFGAGVLVANLFDDDDDDDDHYYGYGYPNWGHGGLYYGRRPYYARNTFVYAPRYSGYRPRPYYRPPLDYRHNYRNARQRAFRRVDNRDLRAGGEYFNRFDKNRNRVASYRPRSPVAGSARAEAYKGLQQSRNANAAQATREARKKVAQGAGSGANQRAREARNTGNAQAARDRLARAKTDGGYKGARDVRPTLPSTRTAQRTERPAAARLKRPAARPDRGYPTVAGKRGDRSAQTRNRGGAIASGAGRNVGQQERAASMRGKASMKSAPRPSSQRAKAKPRQGAPKRARAR